MGKTRGMEAARKLNKLRIRSLKQRWADKQYKKSHLGNEWRKPFCCHYRIGLEKPRFVKVPGTSLLDLFKEKKEKPGSSTF